jgi:hypothetical protein
LKTLRRAQADHGTNPGVKNFTEQSLQRLREDPSFKALAL